MTEGKYVTLSSAMPEETLSIALPDGQAVTAVRTRPAGEPDWLVAYAPGAGSNVHDPFGRFLARRLAERGVSTVRIQFPYMEARKRRPDPPALLEEIWRAAIAALRGETSRLIVGGRSMGGRIASQVVAAGEAVPAVAAVNGLALFAYPLHPPGQPDKLRDKHLPRIDVPALFCSGTRDAFASPDELAAAASKVPNAKLHLLEGADHGFAVPKASGRTKEDVWDEAAWALLEWMNAVT
jgi:predicted alpha/beta-hydrolase family hydrolase